MAIPVGVCEWFKGEEVGTRFPSPLPPFTLLLLHYSKRVSLKLTTLQLHSS